MDQTPKSGKPTLPGMQALENLGTLSYSSPQNGVRTPVLDSLDNPLRTPDSRGPVLPPLHLGPIEMEVSPRGPPKTFAELPPPPLIDYGNEKSASLPPTPITEGRFRHHGHATPRQGGYWVHRLIQSPMPARQSESMPPPEPATPRPTSTKRIAFKTPERAGRCGPESLRTQYPITPNQSPSVTSPPNPPPLRTLPKQVMHFDEVSAHTAKCDTCNLRNNQGMTRCGGCGWQLCHNCRQKRGGNLSHMTFSAEHTDGQRGPAGSPLRHEYTPTTPQVSIRNLRPAFLQARAAEALVEMQSSPDLQESPASPSMPIGSDIDTPTPTPAARTTGRTRSRSHDSDETLSMPAAENNKDELENESLRLFEATRRNPPRRARLQPRCTQKLRRLDH